MHEVLFYLMTSAMFLYISKKCLKAGKSKSERKISKCEKKVKAIEKKRKVKRE